MVERKGRGQMAVRQDRVSEWGQLPERGKKHAMEGKGGPASHVCLRLVLTKVC